MNPYYNKDSLVYHNGAIVKALGTSTQLYSQTLHYGNGIFEGIRAYKTTFGTKIFKARAHYKRLKKGAEVMDIPFNYSVEELIKITYELLKQNNYEDAYIRPLITTGADMSLKTSDESVLTIQCWKWGKYMGDKLLRVKTSKFQRPNPKSCYVDAKVTGHYINSILSANEAKKAGYDEALLLDMNENVAESSGANVFMQKGNILITPKVGHIMPGITRKVVVDLCKEEGIKVEERDFRLQELKTADSAFFTGTAAEVVGLKSLDDYQFPLDWNKSLGKKLMHLYKQEVLCERKELVKV
ncbi:branched-chain-amino-acid transaminase [Winogradskyella haliclonae]|uniref:Branched-chain-amino-acid aminotransferase n=1 Tax=Winogradskyella haliclonae TaxID=2048558 RepID=A0ABQ2BXF0_9FLAO|nr:branched-chain-amino-acid transaminase [Winogradskyella haliclonae]GGI56193.1 branched-chain amino acid aminotransferase [Winogradskyella haliclonae]